MPGYEQTLSQDSSQRVSLGDQIVNFKVPSGSRRLLSRPSDPRGNGARKNFPPSRSINSGE